MSSLKAYGRDLAYIHDVGFGRFALQSAPGLLALLKGSGVVEGLVVDLGCGSGLWARRLVDEGYAALGIDLSADMIAIAGRRVPESTFVVGSFLDVAIPSCRAVTALGEVLSYTFDARVEETALAQLFGRVHDSLNPGGLFVFDICEPGRGVGPGRRHFEGDDWAVTTSVTEDDAARILTRRITTFRRTACGLQSETEVHRLRLYDRVEIAGLLDDCRFEVRIVDAYGSCRLYPGDVAFVARRPE